MIRGSATAVTSADGHRAMREHGFSRSYAAACLGAVVEESADHPALAWRRAGIMLVTGGGEAPGLMCPAPLTAAADGVLAALRRLAPAGHQLPDSGAVLLGERARLLGLRAQGLVSAGGACRILPTPAGPVAMSLVRDEDFAVLPALLEDASVTDWVTLAAALARAADADRPPATMAGLVGRGHELGLAMAAVDPPHTLAADWPRLPGAPPAAPARAPVVVDLSALWAGPLAASLLADLGARVIKVESIHRPDGARRGHGGFYDLLNHKKLSVALDFAAVAGRAALARLVQSADIVIAAARPRVWPPLGLDPAAEAARGVVWVTITGHGDGSVGFGDDAAAAGGLNALMRAHWGDYFFAGDAIADPLTGLHAAYFAYRAWRQGGGARIDISLSGSVSRILAWDAAANPPPSRERTLRWQAMAEADLAPLYPLRAAVPAAAALGAHTDQVLAAC